MSVGEPSGSAGRRILQTDFHDEPRLACALVETQTFVAAGATRACGEDERSAAQEQVSRHALSQTGGTGVTLSMRPRHSTVTREDKGVVDK
jgi:hypothetical protein